jgi:hypothetical protein
MAKSTSNELLASLRENLGHSPYVPPPVAYVEAQAEPVEIRRPLRAKQEAAAKISVSVYPKDIARLDELKDFMRQQGIRNISDSEALRIACRALTFSPNCVEVYHDMQKEDGRRKEK